MQREEQLKRQNELQIEKMKKQNESLIDVSFGKKNSKKSRKKVHDINDEGRRHITNSKNDILLQIIEEVPDQNKLKKRKIK
jgi:hypothetical protein